MNYEYRVVAAPKRCMSKKAVASGQDPATYTIEDVLNKMAAGGWEYQRADHVSLEKRTFWGRTKVDQDMLVFRRSVAPQAPSQPAAQAPGTHAQTRQTGPMIITAEQIRANRRKPTQQPLTVGPRLGAMP